MTENFAWTSIGSLLALALATGGCTAVNDFGSYTFGGGTDAGERDAGSPRDGGDPPQDAGTDGGMLEDGGSGPCGGATCDGNATCDTTGAAPTCVCNDGYEGDGRTCADVDECTDGTDPCDANATCTNEPGSFTCACDAGFTGDGSACTDIDECTDGSAGCDANATCANTDGSFTCTCNTGFSGDGLSCIDNDECSDGTSSCDLNASCMNVDGTFTCMCNAGFTGDGFACADLDECADGSAGCGVNATCANTPGSFTCTCDTGYTGDGFTCSDADECTDGTALCDVNATCTNEPGSYTCACGAGFTGDGFTCTDVNECTAAPCDPSAVCMNTPGSFTCRCLPGFLGDGLTCAPDTRPRGQVVLIGHDLFQRNPEVDELVGNAALLANTAGTIQILGFTQYADVTATGEVANTDAAIQARAMARGRTVNITRFADSALLETNLAGKHVLLIYEQEMLGGGSPTYTTIGTAWRPVLQRFMDRGGVVIALDFITDAWRILTAANLLTLTGRGVNIPTGANVSVLDAADPVARDVSNPYPATNGSTTFAGVTEGIPVMAFMGQPVVVRRPWPCALVGTADATGYTACSEAPAMMPCPDIRTTGTPACTGDDCTTPFTLGFPFDFYGTARMSGAISSNGKLGFPATSSFSNMCTLENETIAPFWDDLLPPGGGAIYYQELGAAPNRRFVVQWNVPHISDADRTLEDVRAVLYEGTNDIDFCYVNTTVGDPMLDSGVSATIGIHGSTAAQSLVTSCNAAVAFNGTVIHITHP